MRVVPELAQEPSTEDAARLFSCIGHFRTLHAAACHSPRAARVTRRGLIRLGWLVSPWSEAGMLGVVARTLLWVGVSCACPPGASRRDVKGTALGWGWGSKTNKSGTYARARPHPFNLIWDFFNS
jgi:hypothetical protein